jgi:hypothetical protein
MSEIFLPLILVAAVLFFAGKIFKKLVFIFLILTVLFGLYTYWGWDAIVQERLPYPNSLKSLLLFFFPPPEPSGFPLR